MFSVYTISGSIYTFDVVGGKIRTMVHGGREMIVNSLCNLKEGSNLFIEGYFINNGNVGDRLTITTTPILKIVKGEEE